MIRNFQKTRKIKVGPKSEYYAIEVIDSKYDKTPVMIIVDPSNIPQIIVPKRCSIDKNISAIIVPDLTMISGELCKDILDVIDNSSVQLYKLPLVGEEHGTVQNSSCIIRVFS